MRQSHGFFFLMSICSPSFIGAYFQSYYTNSQSTCLALAKLQQQQQPKKMNRENNKVYYKFSKATTEDRLQTCSIHVACSIWCPFAFTPHMQLHFGALSKNCEFVWSKINRKPKYVYECCEKYCCKQMLEYNVEKRHVRFQLNCLWIPKIPKMRTQPEVDSATIAPVDKNLMHFHFRMVSRIQLKPQI